MAKLGKKSPFLYRGFGLVCVYGAKVRKVGWNFKR